MSSTHTRLRSRLTAVLATGALAAGALAVTATPAQAADETVSNASFTWGLSGYAQQGIFGPWTFKDFTGDANQLIGSVTTGAADPQTEYVVEPTPVTSFPTTLAGKTPNAVKFTGGDGTIDRSTGEADLTWEGSYTINAYPAMYNAPNEIYSDPHLTVEADGSGTLTVDFTIGAGTDMTGTPFEAKDFGRLTIATFDAGSLTAKTATGYRVTPDYQGVQVTPASGTQTTTCTTDSGATGWWGSWPTEFVNALGSHASGQSVQAHFYSSGCGGAQDKKPPLPFDVKFPSKQGSVQLSQSTFSEKGTQTVTVTGTGFDPAYAVGNTQPPFAGKSSGVYIAFGRFQDVWDPTAGAPSSSRSLADDTANRNGVSVKWAVPAASFPGTPPQDPGAPSYTTLGEDGSFTTTLKVDKAWISASAGNWGIYTYRGGNAAAGAYSTFTPINFVQPTATVSASGVGTSAYGAARTASVSVGGFPGIDAPSGTVSASVNGAVVGSGTLSGGVTSIALPRTLKAGATSVVYSYSGDATYGPSSTAQGFTVAKAAVSVIGGSIKKPTTRKTGKTSLTLRSTTGGPAVTGTTKVTFSKKGQKTKTKTVAIRNGKGNVTIPKLKKGTWKISVKYYGTANFAATATQKIGSVKVSK